MPRSAAVTCACVAVLALAAHLAYSQNRETLPNVIRIGDKIWHILDHLDHYLSACQLGITIASLILGWLAEPAIAQLLLAGIDAMGLEITVSSAVPTESPSPSR